MKKTGPSKAAFWAIIIVMNLSVLAACAAVFFNLYTVSVYKKKNSAFLDSLKDIDSRLRKEAAQDSEPFEFRKPHPYTGFKPSPSRKYASGETFINQLGQRSPDLEPVKPKDTYRIAIVGGSVAFQGALDTNKEDIIARIAELLQRDNVKVQFINASTLSYISNQELGAFVQDLLGLEIDALISLDGFNDIHHAMYYNGRIGWPPMQWDATAEERAKSSFEAPPYYPKIEPNPRDKDLLHRALVNYIQNIRKMAVICQAFNIKYIAVLQPLRGFKPNVCQSKDLEHDFGQKVRFYCNVIKIFRAWDNEKAFGASYISLADLLSNDESLFVDECHFTPKGNSFVAAKLALMLEKDVEQVPRTDSPLHGLADLILEEKVDYDFFNLPSLDNKISFYGLQGIESDAVGRWRWAVGHRVRIVFHGSKEPATLRFAINNPFNGQNIDLLVNGNKVASYRDIPAHVWLNGSVSSEWSFQPVEGENVIEFIFSLVNDKNTPLSQTDTTPYGAAFTDLSIKFE